MRDKIEEAQVLRATVQYLMSRKVVPYQYSLPRGSDTTELKEWLIASSPWEKMLGRGPDFVGEGPDIVAASEREWWAVECKGWGSGTDETHRTQFDRGLASAVSYYEDAPRVALEATKVYLGLALPATELYLRQLGRRVRRPLRRRLNLWVLLYEAERDQIRAVAPDAEYPGTVLV